jgi:biotin transport system substrate-specific component
MAVGIMERYYRVRHDFYAWSYALSVPKKLALAFGWACAVGLLAQVKFYVPWTPVPITGQTFGALLGGVLLGRWWGGIGLAIYAVLGTAGLPWFAGWSSGIPIGPAGFASGGYIAGFIFTALFIGHFAQKYIRARSFFTMLSIMLVANCLCYILGLAQLYYWAKIAMGNVTFPQLLAMGLTPFIAGDITKAVIAAAIARGITTKQPYNGEVDTGKWAAWRVP